MGMDSALRTSSKTYARAIKNRNQMKSASEVGLH